MAAVTLTLALEGPSLDDIDALAARLGIDRDTLVTRAVINYVELATEALEAPETKALFAAAKEAPLGISQIEPLYAD